MFVGYLSHSSIPTYKITKEAWVIKKLFKSSFKITKDSFFKNGPIPASFCLFSFFFHYNFNNTNLKKFRWIAWDLNPRPQDRRMVGTDETTELWRPDTNDF